MTLGKIRVVQGIVIFMDEFSKCGLKKVGIKLFMITKLVILVQC